MVNIVTNKVVRLLGKDETVRFLNLSLYQGAPTKLGFVTTVSSNIWYRFRLKLKCCKAMATSANPILATKGDRDPTLFCTGYKRQRFYMFTQTEPE